MNDSGDPLDAKLRDAAEFLKAGQKKEARKALREALDMDRNHLATWELLWRAAYNVKEELHCLNRILAIDPNHAAAKQRLAAIPSTPDRSAKRSSSRRKRRESLQLLLFLGSVVSMVCMGVAGFALMRGGYIPFSISGLTATALSRKNASCQVLIDKAIQASGDYCANTDSNKACYGNTTIKAELVPDSTQRFSERGDIVPVNELRRISASPLNLDNSEWGIAVFKVIANLPRSLPGETVTMVVFGNTTLDNDSGNLESFYFSSELGQISCEKVPFDGLMITSPDGSGIRFNVNGSELTLMGTASLKANKNGEMEIGLYRGSGRIVSSGREQYFGAGQKVTVKLGGQDGTQSISAPSEPEPLARDELDIACTMTGQYCSQDEIVLISEDEAQEQIQGEITATPTLTLSPTLTPIPSATDIPTNTLLVLPTSTPSPTITPTFTATKPPAPTKTKAPAFTKSPAPTPTPVPPMEPVCGSVALSALTNPNPYELGMTITNNSGGAITINRFFAYWVKTPTSQKLDRLLLGSNLLWNTSDSDTPSDIPAEGSWRSGVDLTIPDTVARNFGIQFQNELQATGYEVHIVFNIGCQVVGAK
ncbi:MAG TPA: hypothetical protein VLT51_12075 [Anaerolineales bacterium]|nr:hypothetical protein [Anaerolineales bacterium]